MRGFLAPGFASARWKLDNDHELGFDWDEARGREGMEIALTFIDRLANHPSGRLSGVVSPMQIENCSDDLLRDSFAASRDRKVPFTLHVSQGILEVHEMIRRHGVTPIRHAKDIGILGPSSVLGHAIFLDTHSWIRWWTKEDLNLLADSGCSVAHCPTPFARYGQIMENFGDYVRAGVNMGIGTDTTPHNMLEEIRKAGTFARIASRDLNNVSTSMLFHAATVGGAKALMRDDLGRCTGGEGRHRGRRPASPRHDASPRPAEVPCFSCRGSCGKGHIYRGPPNRSRRQSHDARLQGRRRG